MQGTFDEDDAQFVGEVLSARTLNWSLISSTGVSVASVHDARPGQQRSYEILNDETCKAEVVAVIETIY